MNLKSKKEYYSVIATPIHISESEIAIICPDYNANWLAENTDYLKSVLYDLGMDTAKHFEVHEVVQHRNRLGNVVTCSRYYGEERSDDEYLRSGYASTAALDKSRNSRLTDDLYRMKALTIDTQMALEARDRYCKIEDDLEEEE